MTKKIDYFKTPEKIIPVEYEKMKGWIYRRLDFGTPTMPIDGRDNCNEDFIIFAYQKRKKENKFKQNFENVLADILKESFESGMENEYNTDRIAEAIRTAEKIQYSGLVPFLEEYTISGNSINQKAKEETHKVETCLYDSSHPDLLHQILSYIAGFQETEKTKATKQFWEDLLTEKTMKGYVGVGLIGLERFVGKEILDDAHYFGNSIINKYKEFHLDFDYSSLEKSWSDCLTFLFRKTKERDEADNLFTNTKYMDKIISNFEKLNPNNAKFFRKLTKDSLNYLAKRADIFPDEETKNVWKEYAFLKLIN